MPQAYHRQGHRWFRPSIEGPTKVKVFARPLKTSLPTVQKWEIGQKKPTGTALKPQHLVQKRRVEIVA